MGDKFELLDGSYPVSDIQDYFEYILKNPGANIDNPSVKIYVNKIENRITFRTKHGCSLEHLTPETIKLVRSTEEKISKYKNGENSSHLEIAEVVQILKLVLVHCNIVILSIMIIKKIQESYTFVPNKPIGSSLEISPANHIFLKTFNSEFQDIEVWFTDQNSQPLEIEDRINLPLVIK